ncbi:putative glycosyl transferase fck3 [Fusarium sp. DS 682]|nr:putative glycosyl transferase fck3 [Fusarium sp. DS 682]
MAIAIPPEFQQEIEDIGIADERSDGEILFSLGQQRPVTSEKNIWAFWDSGLDAMPSWCQRNVISWVRICGPEWTIRVLDMKTGSPNHILKFADRELFPEAFLNGTMDGDHVGQHCADFVRGPLLFRHGGVSLDVGCILLRHIDRICWDMLADPDSPYEAAVPLLYGQTIANHFIASRKKSIFIEKWLVPIADVDAEKLSVNNLSPRHQLLAHLWEGRTNVRGISDSPLLRFVKDIRYEDATDFHWDWSVSVTQFLEYITQVLCWQRLCMISDTGDGFNSCQFWQQKVLCIDVLDEFWGGEKTLGFQDFGPRMYHLLTLRRDADPNSAEYKDAYRLVWRLLTKSSLQKVTHAKNLTNTPHLGTLWDEHEGQDCVPGSFGELLRYGAVHFRQKRPSIRYKDATEPRTTIGKGLLEA